VCCARCIRCSREAAAEMTARKAPHIYVHAERGGDEKRREELTALAERLKPEERERKRRCLLCTSS
jgi:hypothetical protein